ncbi:MAG: HigA family addiction module antitoxin [Deltaproteobacteria bacterium]|nr:HigA family addiction module antitoxin [Deltaproteobacteria bacterium]
MLQSFFRFENNNVFDVNYKVTDAAKGLCVSCKTLSALLNGRFGISPEMAIRLSKGFGGSAESWLIQQSQYDLWKALQNQSKIKVKAFV